MKKRIKILIVDDHTVVIKGIVSLLEDAINYDFDITTKSNCDEALQTLKLALKSRPFDMVFTDLSFSNNENFTIKSGEEFIKILNKQFPKLKTTVITGHSETNRVYNVINNIKPSAYLLKESLSTHELVFTIEQITNGLTYYTHSIHQKILNRSIVQISMDDVAIQILNELPKHTKIRNLEGHIKKEDGKILKIRSIENKISELRSLLDAKNNTDLILKSKELGLID